MNITLLAVKRPIGVTAIALALLLFGGIALTGIGLDFLPSVEFPVAAVITVYPGADPESIESSVTIPLEDMLSSVPGLKSVRSTSGDNVSLIIAEFDWGTDMDAAIRQMETQTTIAHYFFPEQVEPPVIIQTDPDQLPLVRVAVSGDFDESDNVAVDITRRLESEVKTLLEQIPGVASVQLLGAAREEVVVEYDSHRLTEYGITPLLLGQILSTHNAIVPAGTIEQNDRQYFVRAGQVYNSIEDLRNQSVSLEQPEGPGIGFLGLATAMPIRLRDVADVRIQPIPRDGITQVNGLPTVILQVTKQSGANTVQVSRLVQERLNEIENDPESGLSFHTLTAQSDLIGTSLSNLATSGIIGAVLAVAVLLLFLKQLGAVAVIGLAIPLSVIVALISLYFFGVTLNMMSLGGLALSAGILIDNAIIVIENIFRRRSLGESSMEAAIEGGRQIGPAIFAATITTLVVFLPLLFLKSLVGVLFRETAISITVSLVASLLVSLTIVPLVASRLKNDRSKESGSKTTPQTSRLHTAYSRLLQRWTAKPWPTLILIPLLAIATVWLPTTLDTQFLPPTDGGLVLATFSLPPASTFEQTKATAEKLEKAITDIPEVNTILTLSGDQGSEDLLASVQSLAQNEINFTVVLQPRNERQRSADEIAQIIAGLGMAEGLPVYVEADRTTEALGDDFFPGLTLQVRGQDLSVLKSISDELVHRLTEDGRFEQPLSDIQDGSPEFFFRVTERSFQGVRAGGEPLTAGLIGLALRHHLLGDQATQVVFDGTTYPVTLRANPAESADLDALRDFRVPGSVITIGSSSSPLILDRIAELSEQTGVATINRMDRSRVAHVRAKLNGVGLIEAQQIADDIVNELDIPAGYSVAVTGVHNVIEDSISEIIGVLLIAVFLVYVVLAVQFESVKDPLMIMVTVPLAIVGAFAALKMTGHALGIPAFIGLLLLVGISVNHGIIMIDFIKEELRRGLAYREAVLNGAIIRLRPILMTAMTTIFALIPLALAWGEGSELMAPLAVAAIGGLISSTLLTLFIIPGLFLVTGGNKELS